MAPANQMPGFCVINAMHLILWLFFRKMKKSVLYEEQYANNSTEKLCLKKFKNIAKLLI